MQSLLLPTNKKFHVFGDFYGVVAVNHLPSPILRIYVKLNLYSNIGIYPHIFLLDNGIYNIC